MFRSIFTIILRGPKAVTAYSTALGSPEDGRKYGPKHVGSSF